MNIYTKLYEMIGNLKLLKSQSGFPIQLIEFTLSNIPYSNPNWSLKILSKYKKLIQQIELNIFDNVKLNLDNEKIKLFNSIDKQIKSFL